MTDPKPPVWRPDLEGFLTTYARIEMKKKALEAQQVALKEEMQILMDENQVPQFDGDAGKAIRVDKPTTKLDNAKLRSFCTQDLIDRV